MAKTTLINLSDIQEYKPVSSNISSINRIEPYIMEAQDLDIKPFLGDDLYYALIEGKADAKYLLIIEGGSYENANGNTIYFEGLRPALCYFAYARLIENNPLHVTAFGVVKKKDRL